VAQRLRAAGEPKTRAQERIEDNLTRPKLGGSVATEWIKGKTVNEVLGIKNTDIASHLKLPPVKLHCSMLAEDAIHAAVWDWKLKDDEKRAGFIEEKKH